MISSYMTDKIKLVRQTKDEWGSITDTTTDEIDARVEDQNRLVMDSNGNEVVSNMLVILDNGISVNYEDKILIVKKFGVAYPYATQKWKIKSYGQQGGFSGSYIEVYV